jgi:hypothetical protein
MKSFAPNLAAGFKNPHLAACAKLLAQLHKAKTAIADEFSFQTPQRLLRLALNEAEALSWQTGFPQLVFPTLAREKAQALVDWHLRQVSLQQGEIAFAA